MREYATLIVTILILFTILGAIIPAGDASTRALYEALGGVLREKLGTADDRGNLNSFLDYTPIPGSVVLYADGIKDTEWQGVSVNISDRYVEIKNVNKSLRGLCQSDTSCVFYVALDEGTGTTVTDDVNGYTGSFGGAPIWITGRFGNSGLKFPDSPDSYVIFSNQQAFDSFSDGMTVAWWANVSSNMPSTGEMIYKSNNSQDGWRTHIRGSSIVSNRFFMFHLVTMGHNSVNGYDDWIYRDEGEPVEVLNNDILPWRDEKWHFWTFIYNSSPGKGYGKDIYLDGAPWWGWMPNRDFIKVFPMTYQPKTYPYVMKNNVTPWPWGCEDPLNGTTIPYCVWYRNKDGAEGVIAAYLDEPDDQILLAIPRWEYKPPVPGNQHIVLAARIKIVSVDATAGGGVVLRNQWWTSSSTSTVVRDPTIYNYTTPDWITISYTFTTMTNDTIRTDPVLEIRGPITVYVDWINQWPADPANRTVKNSGTPLVLGNRDPAFGAGRMLINGSLDEIIIFNRTLTQTEIQKLYRTPTTWGRVITASYDKAEAIASDLKYLPVVAFILAVIGAMSIVIRD